MLRWAIVFLVIALVSGILGFGNIVGLSTEIARILFVVFLVLFIIAAAANALRGKPPTA